MLLVYNKDIFENPALRLQYEGATGNQLVPPVNWPDYLAVAEFFAKARPHLKGVCMQGAADGWLYYELSNFLFGMGTGTSNKRYGWEEDAEMTIATPKNEAVLRYYKRLRATSSGDFFTIGASQQQEIMLQGKTAIALMWSDYVQPLAYSKTMRFGFAPIPGNVSGLAGGAFLHQPKIRSYSGCFTVCPVRPRTRKPNETDRERVVFAAQDRLYGRGHGPRSLCSCLARLARSGRFHV